MQSLRMIFSMGDPEQKAVVVLDGIVDALGVIVGLTRLHLPGQQCLPAPSRSRGSEPPSESLCRLTTGRIVPRDTVDTEFPMCANCMNVAASLIVTTEHIGGRLRARST
jgi:hypothetical protein